MGFLSNLLSREARKLVSGVVDGVVDDVLDNIRGNKGETVYAPTQSTSTAASAQKKTAVSTVGEDYDEDRAEGEWQVREFIESIAAEEWSEYELRRDISASELGAEPKARDFSYGLYLNGEPKAMIIILEKAHQYQNLDTLRSHDACHAKGVYCMNLLPHLPNRRSYIAGMLRNNVAR